LLAPCLEAASRLLVRQGNFEQQVIFRPDISAEDMDSALRACEAHQAAGWATLGVCRLEKENGIMVSWRKQCKYNTAASWFKVALKAVKVEFVLMLLSDTYQALRQKHSCADLNW
jgi:hypothetical protein